MKEKLKVAFVGYGQRGKGILYHLLQMSDIEVVGVCDAYEDRTQKMVEVVSEARGNTPYASTNYKDVIANCQLDAAFVCTSWSYHVPITIDFMKAGVPVGFEVGGCDSVDECWDLIRTYKETGVECMMLENCCYARREMMVLNMVKQGIFGEIVHCDGAYVHDLREEIATGVENRQYRLNNFLHRNCENYPTHAYGPIAKLLNFNHGNRALTLTSVSSKAVGMNAYAKQYRDSLPNKDLEHARFAQGDIVTTTIKCAGGETITLRLGITLPAFYTRNFNVYGTGAYFDDKKDQVFFNPDKRLEDDGESHKPYLKDVQDIRDEYDHPLWKEYLADGITEGHGGMDWLVLRAFVESVKAGVKPPIDVYDAVCWMVITPLSEQSIAMGGAPVSFPDFTDGKWIEPYEGQEGKYSLDKVCIDPSITIYGNKLKKA